MITEDNNRFLIEAYVNRRARMIMDMVADGLRSEGFTVNRNLMDPPYRLNLHKGAVDGVIDLSRTLLNLATCDRDREKYDYKLEGSVYEMIKITTILRNFLQVIIIVLDTSATERLYNLEDITKTVENLCVQIYG